MCLFLCHHLGNSPFQRRLGLARIGDVPYRALHRAEARVRAVADGQHDRVRDRLDAVGAQRFPRGDAHKLRVDRPNAQQYIQKSRRLADDAVCRRRAGEVRSLVQPAHQRADAVLLGGKALPRPAGSAGVFLIIFMDFLYILDVLHCDSACSRERMAVQLKGLAKAYAQYKGTEFDAGKFRAAFHAQEKITKPHIAVLGARMGQELFEMTSKAMPPPVENDTCVHNRSVGNILPPEGASFDELMDWYAGEILGQIPCMRMMDPTGRKKLYNDPSVAGIIYHTVKFCDFYSFEYAEIKNHTDVPLLKIESDYTIQSSGQLLTRLEAFAESIQPETLEQTIDGDTKGERKMGKGYFAGIDSGSTSTDVVILNKDHEIVTSIILPTGAGAAIGADRALAEALKEAGLQREDIDALVTTGYGRTAIKNGDKSITEITCHARGAHFLNPEVRTVIDIGGQDSKVIRLDENGAVANFVMNDKCAAGTGRFLEMMARTMEMNLDQMSECGLEFKEDITISSMCTVFAESEVVSLIAQNKATDDIVHGLNKAVAVKTAALTRRVGGEEKYMMTGGVSKNKGLVKTLEEKLGTKLVISDKAQLCGALGAALFAADMADV